MKYQTLAALVAGLVIGSSGTFLYTHLAANRKTAESTTGLECAVLTPVYSHDGDNKNEIRWGKLAGYERHDAEPILEALKSARQTDWVPVGGSFDGISFHAVSGRFVVGRAFDKGYLMFSSQVTRETDRYVFCQVDAPHMKWIKDEALWERIGKLTSRE